MTPDWFPNNINDTTGDQLIQGYNNALDDVLQEMPEYARGWIPLTPPKPKDEKRYNILLKGGSEIKDVEYWAFGGGFKPLKKSIKGRLVQYPLFDVEYFMPLPPTPEDK